MESTLVSSKVLLFAGRRWTEIYGRSSKRKGSPTLLGRRSVTRVLESRNVEEGSTQSACPSLESLGPRDPSPRKRLVELALGEGSRGSLPLVCASSRRGNACGSQLRTTGEDDSFSGCARASKEVVAEVERRRSGPEKRERVLLSKGGQRSRGRGHSDSR